MTVVPASPPQGLAAGEGPDDLGAFSLLLRWQRTLDVSGRCNANTRTQYRRILMSFWADVVADPAWPGSRDVLEVTEDDVVEYVNRLAAGGATRSSTIKALRSFYGWAAERGEVARNPLARIKPRRQKYGPAPRLDPDQLERVLAAAAQIDPRAPWAIQLQYATATRAGSLVQVRPEDIRHGPQGASIFFRTAKGDKPYEIPLGPRGLEAVEHLLELIAYRPARARSRRQTLLGVGYSAYASWVQRTGEAAGIDINSHLLRHTAITVLAENGVDVRTIMEVANWEDPKLLRRYAAASDPNLREAVRLL